MMRRLLALLAPLCVLVPFRTQAQVLEHLPGINDGEPQVIYDFIGGGNALLVKSAVKTGVPDRRFRSLTNYYELGGWSAGQRETGAISDMYHSDRWVSEFLPLGWDPLPHKVEGLAWIPEAGRLIGMCAG